MTAPAAAPAAHRRFTLAVGLLFVGSGCAALIYEVVWFHLLRLVVGSSAVSLGFLLGSFMGGMCLGSLLLPRWIPARRHPLRVYAALELAIGAIGVAMPVVLPWLGGIYTAVAGSGPTELILRGVVCAVALLLPTMLMGATLPAIARWVDTSRAGIASMGAFYGANIAGAVAGTLLAGFYLLRVHDVVVASWVAATINASVAFIALALASVQRFEPLVTGDEREDGGRPRRTLVLVAIAFSGLTALGAEVVWTRLLSLLFGATVYTFSLILAVFLVGLGIGSAAGARLAARVDEPRRWLGACQLLLVPAILWTAWAITRVIPYAEPTYVFQRFVYENAWVRFPWDFARCTFATLPGPLLWGASFPLALAAAGEGHRDAGRMVGGVYAANTVGAIVGALVTSLVAVGGIGTRGTQQVLAWVAGGTAVAMLVTARWPERVLGRIRVAVLSASAIVAVPFVVPLVPGPSEDLIAYGRNIVDWHAPGTVYEYGAEGMNASVAVSLSDGIANFHVSGKVVASTADLDMRLQRMLGHLPVLVHGAPRSVLVVGCGAGVTAGCFVDYPGVERIVICEIEPRVVDAARAFFGGANGDVLDDPRTEIVLDDARHYLATTSDTFDIVTSDPIHPWVRGAAALYSREYYELVQRHLEPGAVVTQWVPLYQTDEASVKSQMATFFRGFGGGSVWNSDVEQYGYDLVLMSPLDDWGIDVDAIEAELVANHSARRSLEQVGLGTAVLLMQTYAGNAIDLADWLADAQLNDDVGLRLQYLAGLSIDLDRDFEIYRAIKQAFRYPEELFFASPSIEAELRRTLTR